MKYFFLSLALMAVFTYSQAHVRTCNNKTPSPGQYSTLSAAYTASAAGDTIYLSGSPTSYGTLTVAKTITIIGTGFNLTDKQDASISIIDYITLSTSADNSNFMGLEIAGNPANSFSSFEGFDINGSLTGISITRCRAFDGIATTATQCFIVFHGSYTLTNLIIKDCFIYDNNGISSGGSFANASFFNSIFRGFGFSANYTGGNFYNDVLDAGTPLSISNFTSCNFYNSIFYWSAGGGLNLTIGGTPASDFAYNNVAYTTGGSLTHFNASFPLGDNNIYGKNPLFVNEASENLHLQSGSPAHNEGNDATDAGIYGGTLSNSYLDTGEPAIPQIRSITAPATTASGGNVNANVISTRKP